MYGDETFKSGVKNMKKRKWSKPECQRVKLVPEEAVLWGCKSSDLSVYNFGWWGPCSLKEIVCSYSVS